MGHIRKESWLRKVEALGVFGADRDEHMAKGKNISSFFLLAVSSTIFETEFYSDHSVQLLKVKGKMDETHVSLWIPVHEFLP